MYVVRSTWSVVRVAEDLLTGAKELSELITGGGTHIGAVRGCDTMGQDLPPVLPRAGPVSLSLTLTDDLTVPK